MIREKLAKLPENQDWGFTKSKHYDKGKTSKVIQPKNQHGDHKVQ